MTSELRANLEHEMASLPPALPRLDAEQNELTAVRNLSQRPQPHMCVLRLRGNPWARQPIGAGAATRGRGNPWARPVDASDCVGLESSPVNEPVSSMS